MFNFMRRVRENAKFNLIVSLSKEWIKKGLVSFVAERDHKWPVVAAADAEYVGAERAV